MAILFDRIRQALGNFADTAGTQLGLPETGLSERIAGGPTVNTATNRVQASTSAPNQSTLIPGSSETDPRFQNFQPPADGGGGGDTSGGGGGGGGGFRDPDFGDPNNPDLSNPIKQTAFDNYQRLRGNTESAAQKALKASLGVFESRKQGLLNRIPGLEKARDLRLRGLDEGLEQFVSTSDREQGKRVGEVQETAGRVAGEFKTAERKNRASAKGLARQLRNIFAAAGTVDSTQFRDKNVEQSSQVLQSLGDLRRSGAEKAGVFGKEEENIKSFFTEKVTQQRQQIALSKDNAVAETQTQIQGVMDSVDLNDSQKIEAVQAANVRLQDRLASIDQQELTFNQQAAKDAQDLAIKLQELRSKGTSTAFKSASNTQKSFKDATATISKLRADLGQMTPQVAANVFAQFGFADDEAQRLGQTYATSTTGNSPTDENPFASI